MKKKLTKTLGSVLIFIGIILLFNSFSGITGFSVLKNAPLVTPSVGIVLIILGILILQSSKHKIASRINKDTGLERMAREAGDNQTIQREIDHLTYELNKGNTNAGLGTKKLFGPISYLRGRNGGRVFYRPTEKGYEILAKSSKANESSVIERLEQKYNSKRKRKSA